jgi:hypothetical protein
MRRIQTDYPLSPLYFSMKDAAQEDYFVPLILPAEEGGQYTISEHQKLTFF